MKIYGAYDKVSCRLFHVFLANNDADALRSNLYGLTRLRPSTDIEIYSLCDVLDEFTFADTKEITDFNPIGQKCFDTVDKTSYHFDEVTASKLNKTDALEQIEYMNKMKELQIAKLQKEIDENK